MSPPSLISNKSGSMNELYKSTTGVFGFENPVKTTIDSSQEMLVFVSAMTETKMSTILQEQKGRIPYTAIITLTNKNTGDLIMNYTTSGTWVGVTTSSVRTDIYSTPTNCVT